MARRPPFGRTLTWEEARGPHLPDRLTRVPLPVWPFLILAVVQVVAIAMDDWTLITNDPGGLVLTSGGSIAASLLGAALFLRHPDAVRTLPLLVVGVTLVAVERVISLLNVAFGWLFAGLWIVPVDGSPDYTSSSMFSIAGSAIGVLAVLCLARGLAAARRFEGGVSWSVLIVLIVASILITAASVISYQTLPSESVIVGPLVYAASLVIGLASTLAMSYLFAVALAGWRAGERPPTGWALVVASGLVTIAIAAMFAVVIVIQPGDLWPMATIIAIAAVASPLMLLVAFAIGLPATEPDATPDPPGVTTRGSAGS